MYLQKVVMAVSGTSQAHSKWGNIDDSEQVPTAKFFPAIEDEDLFEEDLAWPLLGEAGTLSAFSKLIQSGG